MIKDINILRVHLGGYELYTSLYFFVEPMVIYCKLRSSVIQLSGLSHYSAPLKLEPPHYGTNVMMGAIGYLTTKG